MVELAPSLSRVERMSLGRMQNPVRGFLHGSAAVAAAAGLVVLAWRSGGDWTRLVPVLIFGTSLLAMFTVSALYHSMPWRDLWKHRMQRLDHSMIFVVVASTYTPLAVIVLEGTWRCATLAPIWLAALIGVAQKAWWPRVRSWFSVTLQTSMGWFALIPLAELTRRLGAAAIVLILAGGACYTAGMVMYATRRPRLFPRVFSYHEVFHLLVIAGATFHFAVVLSHVLPYPG